MRSLMLVLAISAGVGLVPGQMAKAQVVATASYERGPRFLLARDSEMVPVDVNQTPVLARRLNLDLVGATLKDALTEIENQSGLRLVYSDDTVPLEKRVHLQAEAITAAAALTDMLFDAGVDVVFKADGSVALVKRPPPPPTGSILGRVTNAQSGEAVEGVEVYLRGTRWQTRTAADGHYRLAEVDTGTYVVTARRIGYTGQSRSVTVVEGQEATADFALQAAVTTLGEVVVTAQKREERLIDVPQSVTVLNPTTLTAQGALQLRDYADRIPGVSAVTQGAGYTQIVVRGLTTGISDAIASTVTYVDEVPYGWTTHSSGLNRFASLDAGLFDLERIEVLKGPQGTLYGADAMGGLIKYATKPPSTERFGGQVQAGPASTWDGGVSYNAAAAANIPLVSEQLALRASGWYSRDGGYIQNLALAQKDINRSGIYGGRLDFLFTPTEKLSVRLGGFLQNISRDGSGYADYDLSGRPVDGNLDQRRPTAEPYYQRFRLVGATVTYDWDWARLTSISSYQTTRLGVGFDASYAIPAFEPSSDFYGFTNGLSGIADPFYGRTNKFTQELRLLSERRGPLEWVIGGFYTHEATDYDVYLHFFDVDGQPTGNSNATDFNYSTPTSFHEYAPFGTLTWHLSSQFDVSAGMRYSHSAQTYSQRAYATQPYETVRSSESVFTYLANARYHFSDRAVAHFRYATGYRPGGPNFTRFDIPTGMSVPQPPFKSDKLKTYELGFKGETEHRRFGLEAAAFYYDWSNLQTFTCGTDFCGYTNISGGARILGTELALTARPIKALTLASALTYLDGRLRQAEPALGGAKGERLPTAPRYQANLTADYVLAPDGLRPTLGASLRYVPERKATLDGGSSIGTPQYHLPAYTAVDLHAGLTLGRVETQLYVRNLFDERGQLSAVTYAAAAPYNGPAQISIIQPRTIGVTASMDF